MFMNGFYLQHGKCSLVCTARLVVIKLVSIETKLSYEKLRKLRWQRVSSDV